MPLQVVLSRGLLGRRRLQLAAVVLGATGFDSLLALPIRAPRIFGDELIYWELSRGFAWTGHLTVRGGSAPRYGPVYPALLALAQRIGGDQTAAFAVAQVLNAVLFSLAAVPIYAIASRVLTPRPALLAALLAVVLPSCVYTSTMMTENAFYPLFSVSVWLMLRALERPSAGRQILVAASVAATFLVRAQAVVLLPAYLVATVLTAVLTRDRAERSAPAAAAAAVRQHVPTIVLVGVGAVVAAGVRGRTTLGPYHVLVASYSPRVLAHWVLANLADLDLYLGVIPLAVFGVLLVQALAQDVRLSLELRRLVLLVACVGTAMLATVAVLGASQYGLGRVHERNLFDLVPLVFVCFVAWLAAGQPRPRRTTAAAALAVVLLPLALPASAVKTSGEDGIALEWWDDMAHRARDAIAGMVLVAAVAALVFLVSRRPRIMVGVCLAALSATLVGAEVRAVADAHGYRSEWRDRGWIDRAVGPDARVVELWTRSSTAAFYPEVQRFWADEFFNRSVRDVASAGGVLPDGLPVRDLAVRSDGCLAASFATRPQYAVVEATSPLQGRVVRISPSGRAILYRLEARPARACFARFQAR